MFEGEVVGLVVGGGVGGWGGEAVDFDCAVVGGGGEVFVGGVEGDAFDVGLVGGEGLEFLKGRSTPDDDFTVETDADEDATVT